MSWLTSSWPELAIVAAKAALMYGTALVALRVAQRRTLAQWTIIDFAAAVAIGAIIGRTAVAQTQSYATGAVALLNAPSTSRVSRYVRRRSDGIVGRQLHTMACAGQIRLMPYRVVAARGRQVTLADGTLLPVSSVLSCTGFRPDTSWIEVPGATDDRGARSTRRGRPRCSACSGWASPQAGCTYLGVDRPRRGLRRVSFRVPWALRLS